MAVDHGTFFDEFDTLSPRERDRRSKKELRKTVEHAYRYSAFTRNLLDKAGVKIDQIRNIRDLELLPITRKNDIIEAQKIHPPFGGLSSVSALEIERIFISPGPIYEYQPSGIQWFARSFHAAGFGKGDIAVNTFTYHMSPAGILFQEGLRQVGATVVVMGTGNSDTLIKTMLDLKVNCFVGTPTFLMNVIKRAEEMGYQFKSRFGLKKAWFTGEMLSASLRKLFENDYQISTFQAYAVTEPGGAIAYECSEKSGMHLMEEYVVEIIDPQTGKQLGPGEVGEIVVTPIHNKTWGLIRFGTGDLSSFTTESCPCGRTAYRIAGIVGRTGDAVKVRGMFIVVKQVEQVISSFTQVNRFQIIVDRKENRDEMVLKLELTHSSEDKKALSDSINSKFQDICRLKLDLIEFVNTGAIAENRSIIDDIRKWD
jgi:phenylacetate-CoA ligase